MGMDSKALLILALFVIGIYVLPSAVAKFAGSHTWEFNASTRVTGLQCGRCHMYIVEEINNSEAKKYAGDAITRHLNASNSTDYINSSTGPLRFDGPGTSWAATLYNVCWMCHVVEGGTSVTGTHTKVTIRVCTDIDCHGNPMNYTDNFGAPAPATGSNKTSCDLWGEDHCNVTGRINTTADAHYNFYRAVANYSSPYGNENGGQYNYGFIACLACHTHVGLDLNLTRPQKLSLSMKLVSMQTGWNATSLSVNYTNMTSTVGGKNPGSVWKP